MPDEQNAPEGFTETALQNLEAYVKRCKMLPEWEALRLIAEIRRLLQERLHAAAASELEILNMQRQTAYRCAEKARQFLETVDAYDPTAVRIVSAIEQEFKLDA
jgi:hypothetical protein